MLTRIKENYKLYKIRKDNRRERNNLEYQKKIDSCNIKLFGDNYKKRMVIYTAIIGKYDNLLTQNNVSKYCDYYCITDNKDIKPNGTWKVIYIDKDKYGLNDIEQTKIARFIKTHPHIFFSEYKHSLWIDSNIIIERDISEWISDYLGNEANLLAHLHSDRQTLNEEIEEILKENKDRYENIHNQVEKYKQEGFDCDAKGLIMTNVIYRKNNNDTNRFNEIWWEEIKNNSKRDQISFNYAVWKSKLKISTSDLDPFGNIFFTRLKHQYK